MKSDLTKIRIKRTFRDKSNNYVLIINLICSFVLFCVLLFIVNLNNYVEKSINSNIGFRTLSVPPDIVYKNIDYSKINQIKDVVMVYDSGYNMITIETSFKNDKYDGLLNFVFDPENKYLSQESNGVAVCPQNFYPDSNVGLNLKNEDIIDGNSLIGKEFTITYIVNKEKREQKFKIINTYDSSKNLNSNNTCYITYHDLVEIADAKLNVSNSFSKYDIAVVVNNVKNVDYVKQELNKMGFDLSHIESLYNIDYQMVNSLKFIGIIIGIIVFIVMFVVITMYNINKIHKETSNAGLLKILGYSDRRIKAIFILEASSLSVFAISIGLLFSLVFLVICKQVIFRSLKYLGISIISPFLYLIILYILLIGLCIVVVYIITSKKMKTNIKELKKE